MWLPYLTAVILRADLASRPEERSDFRNGRTHAVDSLCGAGFRE